MSELDEWRQWAQFIYLGGGPVTLPDRELRAAVCAEHDQQVSKAQETTDFTLHKAQDWIARAEAAEVALHAERARVQQLEAKLHTVGAKLATVYAALLPLLELDWEAACLDRIPGFEAVLEKAWSALGTE